MVEKIYKYSLNSDGELIEEELETLPTRSSFKVRIASGYIDISRINGRKFTSRNGEEVLTSNVVCQSRRGDFHYYSVVKDRNEALKALKIYLEVKLSEYERTINETTKKYEDMRDLYDNVVDVNY